MAQRAPELPTTEELQSRFAATTEQLNAIGTQRYRNSVALRTGTQFFVGTGQCGPTGNELELIESEGTYLEQRQIALGAMAINQRLNIWKPRTNPSDWHGLETSDPELAYTLVAQQALRHHNVIMEIGQEYHLDRYAMYLSAAWLGGRNIDNLELMELLAKKERDLPLLVKNGLDGDIDKALDRVAWLQEMRDDHDAPIVLLYRGGENAKSPHAWEEEYKYALRKTKGMMVVDTAHGSEMAHDPEGGFKKTVEGQIQALYHVISLMKAGHMPRGVLMEASDAETHTDPLMSFQVAMEGLMKIHKIYSKTRQSQPRQSTRVKRIQ